MSLNTLPGNRRRPLHGWSALWPFWLFLLLLSIALGGLLLYWPQIMQLSVLWQKQLHHHMAGLLLQVRRDPRQAGTGLLLFSLGYGVLHAVGPGHGKMVIAAYLATQRSRLKLSLAMTLLASLLQGAMAIMLVTLVLVTLRLSTGALHLGEFWLEKSSYLLVAALGLALCRRALANLAGGIKGRRRAFGRITGARYIGLNRAGPRPANASGAEHGAICACGHRHLPDNAALARAGGWRTRLAVVAAMGFRPCSGAVLVLLFAKVLGVYRWGVLAALVMSAGTAFTLLTIALLVFVGRRYAERLTRSHSPRAARDVAWATLSLAGGLLLTAAGVILYLSAQPAIMGALRPFSHA